MGGIKIYKQISVAAKKYQEAIDSIMQVCLDPSKGLSEESLEIAKSRDESGFFDGWFGMSPSGFLAASVVVAGASLVGFNYLRKNPALLTGAGSAKYP